VILDFASVYHQTRCTSLSTSRCKFKPETYLFACLESISNRISNLHLETAPVGGRHICILTLCHTLLNIFLFISLTTSFISLTTPSSPAALRRGLTVRHLIGADGNGDGDDGEDANGEEDRSKDVNNGSLLGAENYPIRHSGLGGVHLE